ncbi:MAG TPA: E3 binding domain-containing protein, partial [Polyangiaceae bacterium]|nr:E3 binding domain-containing protein [Polyangiaceae bacterium]
MSIEVKVNELPESVADGVLLAWHKQPGDRVKAGEVLVELETDKVVLELQVPNDGVLGPHRRNPGDTVKRGDVIAIIEDVAGAEPPPPAPAARAQSAAPGVEPAAAPPRGPAPPAPPAAAAPPAVDAEDGPGLAPAVRRLLEEHGLSPADITGSGPRGRLTKEDVLRHLEHSPHLVAKIGEAAPVVTLLTPSATAPGGLAAERPTA